jgi:serine protease Do
MSYRPAAALLCLLVATLPAASRAQPAVSLQGPQGALPSLAPLVDSVKAAVVNVDVQAARGRGDEDEDPWSQFFGRRGRRSPRELMRGAGSGFIVDPMGLVLTNNHVVDGAVAIHVKLNDGRAFDADVVGRDPLTDVAVLRIKGAPGDLPSVKLGDSDALKVGDWAVAIGNPFGLASSVSVGIISARARDIHAGPYDEFLQTDAAINPGNSGGPLFNLRGEVVGINTAIVASGSGIGFAVPSNLVKALLPQLEKEGAVTRAWLGIGIQDLSVDLAQAMGLPVSDGAVVTEVNDGSPAAKGGLKPDDVITAVDGQKVSSGGQLSRTVALKKPGTTATLTVFRGGNKSPQQVKVQLGTRPDLEGVAQRPGNGGEDGGGRARLGLGLSDVDPRYAQANGIPPVGVMITEVAPGSPAERAQLSPGMVITEVDRKPVRNRAELWAVLQQAKPRQVLLLRLRAPRGGQLLRALTVP